MKAVPSRSVLSFCETDESLPWCDQVFNGAARNEWVWYGDTVLNLVPTSVLPLMP